MRLFLRLVSLAFITSLLAGTAWPQSEPALIPRQAFFANPDKEQVMLSPDGKWIGYRALSENIMNLWIAPISDPAKARVVIKQSGAPVVDYRWAYLNGRVLYRVPNDEDVHVFLLNLESGESRNLTPGKGVVAFIERFSPDHIEEALLRVKEPARASFDYRRINLRTGAPEVVFKNDQGFERVLFDDDWRPRVAVSRKPEQGYELLQPNDAREWVSFASFRDGMEANASQPILLDKAGKTLYLTDNRGRDKAALQSIDLASGKETLLVEDAFADILPALLFHPQTGRVQTASAYYGRLRRHFLDPTILPDFEYLRTVQRGDIGLLQQGILRSDVELKQATGINKWLEDFDRHLNQVTHRHNASLGVTVITAILACSDYQLIKIQWSAKQIPGGFDYFRPWKSVLIPAILLHSIRWRLVWQRLL